METSTNSWRCSTRQLIPKSRDKLAAWQLYKIEKLQFIARTIIAGLLARGEDYHLPYRDCKAAFETYARLSFLNQRFLETR